MPFQLPELGHHVNFTESALHPWELRLVNHLSGSVTSYSDMFCVVGSVAGCPMPALKREFVAGAMPASVLTSSWLSSAHVLTYCMLLAACCSASRCSAFLQPIPQALLSSLPALMISAAAPACRCRIAERAGC
eukprot:scaffold414607_cov19-Prasinocladus_malaysianus.AAC.1